MNKKPKYDIDASWDDPYASGARQVERRTHPRGNCGIEVKIATDRKRSRKRLVANGRVYNVSLVGMYLKTRHVLAAGQRVDLAIPVVDCPGHLTLPKAFLEPARVVRVDSILNGVCKAALHLEGDEEENMDYTLFIQHLHANPVSTPSE